MTSKRSLGRKSESSMIGFEIPMGLYPAPKAGCSEDLPMRTSLLHLGEEDEESEGWIW